jgi:hypothetical protein
MDEVTPGLWIGDLQSALNVEQLKANNIHSILSVMRGRIKINEVNQTTDPYVVVILNQFRTPRLSSAIKSCWTMRLRKMP